MFTKGKRHERDIDQRFNGKMMVKHEMIENLTKDLNQIRGETIALKNHYESEIDQRKAHEECIYQECDKQLRQKSDSFD